MLKHKTVKNLLQFYLYILKYIPVIKFFFSRLRYIEYTTAIRIVAITIVMRGQIILAMLIEALWWGAK